jgi:hypothetical protein
LVVIGPSIFVLKLEVVHDQVAIVLVTAQKDQNIRGVSVNVAHHNDLRRLFGVVSLVDADGVYPHDSRGMVVSQAAKCFRQVRRDIERLAAHRDGQICVTEAPDVGQRFVLDTASVGDEESNGDGISIMTRQQFNEAYLRRRVMKRN